MCWNVQQGRHGVLSDCTNPVGCLSQEAVGHSECFGKDPYGRIANSALLLQNFWEFR